MTIKRAMVSNYNKKENKKMTRKMSWRGGGSGETSVFNLIIYWSIHAQSAVSTEKSGKRTRGKIYVRTAIESDGI